MTIHSSSEENPYLSEVLSIMSESKGFLTGRCRTIEGAAKLFESRRRLRLKYAFAIPNDDALRKIAKYSPIVEIGAGKGYWANLLSLRGVDIVAYDNWKNLKRKRWFDVQYSDESVVKQHGDRTLFLCWPPNDNEMAFNALKQYTGETVIYIGEEKDGCTGTNSFFKFLKKNFNEKEKIEIPKWPQMHDSMTIFKRKSFLAKYVNY